jgi:hypothetical protein
VPVHAEVELRYVLPVEDAGATVDEFVEDSRE